MNPSDPATTAALTQAQATIALLQTYVAALGGTIGLMGAFFGYKWIGAIIESTKADSALATSNDKLTDAVKALTEAVVHKGG
jgi:hypothetical protein